MTLMTRAIPTGPDEPENRDRIAPRFRVGGWTIEPERNRLLRGEIKRKVEPKVMEVLVELAKRPGRTISRQELLDAVWGEVCVVDRVVNRIIWELRRALDDDARDPRYIETIPKRGYRLMTTVEPLAPEIATGPTRGGRPRTVGAICALGLLLVAFLIWVQAADRPLSAVSSLVRPTTVRLLTSEPGWEYDPVLSPDGRELVFVAYTGSWDLFHLPLGDEASQLSTWRPLSSEDGAEGHPVFSPDGTRLAYYRHRTESTTLHLRTLGGVEQELLTARADYPELDFSPDGNHLVFRQESGGQGGPQALYELELARGDVRQLTDPPLAWRGDSFPRFSPDGHWLAFVRTRSEGLDDLYLFAPVSGETQRLTADGMPISGLTWKDDGTLLFASRRAGTSDLWYLAIDPTRGRPRFSPRRLGLSGWRPGSPFWRGEDWGSGRLVFVSWAGDTNLWRVPLGQTDGEPTRVIASTRWDLHPAISPDGQRIAFASNRSGHYEIWTADADGRNPHQETHFEGPFTGTPDWSPDGRRLIFDARPDGHADLFELDLDAATISRLTTTPTDEQNAIYSPDGNIIFAANRGASWQVWCRDATGNENPVTHDGGFAPRISADGRWVYYLKPRPGGLWRARLDGSDETRLPTALTLADAGAWAVASSGLYVVERDRTRRLHSLVHLDLDTGNRQEIHTATAPIPYYDLSLAIAPDETWLLLGQQDRRDSDLYLVDGWDVFSSVTPEAAEDE